VPTLEQVEVGLLNSNELSEANRIFRLAFGTFLGLPDPMAFAGDREMVTARWPGKHVTMLAARKDGRLIGSNVLTRWGTFGFFGPLTVLPEYWDRGVARALMEATVDRFDRDGLARTALFTFPHSTKHVGLYSKFGYWPGYLTALMKYEPKKHSAGNGSAGTGPVVLSHFKDKAREQAIESCRELTDALDKGLDLSSEIRLLLAQNIGDVVLTFTQDTLDAFAVCHHGAGSEAGTQLCYVKFAATRAGAGAGERFDRLLNAMDAFAMSHGVPVEAGVNMAREDAFRRMVAHGFKPMMQGVAMQRPHAPGYNRADAYVLDDWR
jgi:GNAT superfamily N-acetyltransferase